MSIEYQVSFSSGLAPTAILSNLGAEHVEEMMRDQHWVGRVDGTPVYLSTISIARDEFLSFYGVRVDYSVWLSARSDELADSLASWVEIIARLLRALEGDFIVLLNDRPAVSRAGTKIVADVSALEGLPSLDALWSAVLPRSRHPFVDT